MAQLGGLRDAVLVERCLNEIWFHFNLLRMSDDLIAADVDYRCERIIQEGNLVTCLGTEDLPAWGQHG